MGDVISIMPYYIGDHVVIFIVQKKRSWDPQGGVTRATVVPWSRGGDDVDLLKFIHPRFLYVDEC